MRTFLPLSLAIAVVACSGAERGAADAVIDDGAKAAPAAPAKAAAPADKARPFAMNDAEEGGAGSREYRYSWPVEVSREPALVRQFKATIAEDLAQQKVQWQEAVESCPPDSVSCSSNTLSVEWKVVANLPRFLSLSSDVATYTGGAHGNYGRGALVWDRQTETSLDPKDMFDLAALDKATATPRCRRLNAERAKRRGEPVPANSSEWSEDCPEMDLVTLFVGSSDGSTFDRLGFYYAPYVAGSYAEGEYEVDLPVNAAVLAAVRPQYRAVFTANR